MNLTAGIALALCMLSIVSAASGSAAAEKLTRIPDNARDDMNVPGLRAAVRLRNGTSMISDIAASIQEDSGTHP